MRTPLFPARPLGAGLTAGLLLWVALPAFAQDLDEEQPEASGRKRARDFEGEVVREVVRGYYLKADLGTTVYLNTHGVRPPGGGSLLSGVMSMTLGIGGEFIDKERISAAWEIDFNQGLFNGPRYEELTAIAPLLEGDIHTFAGFATVEVSGYVSRRFGIGGRAGGGAMVAPLLMGEAKYQSDVVAAWGSEAKLHQGPLPMIVAGPTIEYYTKLSHFSVGIDGDITYVIGFDLGVSPYGYLKYTF